MPIREEREREREEEVETYLESSEEDPQSTELRNRQRMTHSGHNKYATFASSGSPRLTAMSYDTPDEICQLRINAERESQEVPCF
jgi:hypothetical protein